ncbi:MULTISPECIES: NADH-quinone oxidoreductase subunit J family protein [Phocaeicola]|uniref:NADH-quinone oxidoreductase subunit J family protein n=1 Tax=Phocaeicola TaxID=909656 RepID=UPI0008223A1D|nr:NADH-quinone oxidoreductase subunit J [Phocaeicola fibrisolvens]MCU6778726.1 NADH-quinone oxidoreductase subunit J [Phocaeicola fibrisolvens]SCI04047.1 NADH-quinone oxidoreductase subunit J [uncultured Bacteroides sp.]
MNISLQEIVFYIVGACIIVSSILAVTTGRLLRAATYLLFVLFGTGAIYGILGYTFLSAVQLMVYAGGIVVLYVFSILLTQSDKNMKYKQNQAKLISVLITTVVGAVLVLFLVMTNGFALNLIPQGVELPVDQIGHALIGTDKYQFVLPFEAVSVLLLACMIGAILIARKEK